MQDEVINVLNTIDSIHMFQYCTNVDSYMRLTEQPACYQIASSNRVYNHITNYDC